MQKFAVRQKFTNFVPTAMQKCNAKNNFKLKNFYNYDKRDFQLQADKRG